MNTENNILIASFMGIDEIQSDILRKSLLRNLEYHCDWEELMKVVDKIETIDNGTFKVEIYFNECVVYHVEDHEIIRTEAGNKKQAVYNACVEFIKYYKK